MMYQDKLVVAIKSNGKVLREAKDLVMLPFGSEFTVLVKNLNSRRAKFTLNIDGTDVLDGTEIIVNANSEVEMKRFIRNGNMNEGNAFKFIERTVAIEDGPRGIKVDDGIVRVEFWFEQEKPVITTTVHKHYDEWYHNSYPSWNPSLFRSYPAPRPTYNVNNISTLGATSSADISKAEILNSIRGLSASASVNAVNAANATATFDTSNISDAGITVPGSEVEQKFHTVYGFNAETVSHVIVLRLAGKVGSVEVAAPVTVKTKNKCVTCGHINKHNAKFCSQCGTALEIV